MEGASGGAPSLGTLEDKLRKSPDTDISLHGEPNSLYELVQLELEDIGLNPVHSIAASVKVPSIRVFPPSHIPESLQLEKLKGIW